MAHINYAKEVYKYLREHEKNPENELLKRLSCEPEILALAKEHGGGKCRAIAESIEQIQKESRKSYRHVTDSQRETIVRCLTEDVTISFESLMIDAYGENFFSSDEAPEYIAEGIEISPTFNVAFGLLGTAAVGKDTTMDRTGVTYRATRNAILAINTTRYGEPQIITVDIDDELIVATVNEAKLLEKKETPCKRYEQIDEWLSVKDLAQQVGVSAGRIRQIINEIPGGQLTELGWKFPSSAVNYLKQRPDGRFSVKKDF